MTSWCVYTVESDRAIKKNEGMSFAATWMDLDIVILSEGNQTETEKYMKPLICGIYKEMIQLNLKAADSQS